ncbi:MAG: ATP-dependent Clp protease ATP-binding subunit [Planctomycetes bacterium]|nr:ATP-dependent Clp protease ATP-binding subunit [Planctomycetota bacterium]
MFDRFTQRARKVMGFARREAQELNHEYIGTEHILLGLIREGNGVAAGVISSLGINLEAMRKEVLKNLTVRPKHEPSMQVPFTPRAKKAVELALEEAKNIGHGHVGTEHLLLALLRENEGIAPHILRTMGCRLEEVRESVIEFIGGISNDEGDADVDMPHIEHHDGDTAPARSKTNTPALDGFGRDLTEACRRGELDPVIGRESEITRVVQVLSRRTKNNPVLLGEPGVGKTAIIEGLAQSIVNGTTPEILADKRIISLDLPGMVAGTKYRGQFEERIKAVMAEVKAAKNVILFIDEIHTLVGAGGAEGAIDAANVLKPALSRGEIQVVGATTLDEYRKNIEKDGALERRFQSVRVEPPCRDDTVAILAGLRSRYEDHHKISYSDEALEAAVDLSIKYINNRFLPDKAIDVIDEAGARVRLGSLTPPPDVEAIDLAIKEHEQAKEHAVANQEFELAASHRDQAYEAKRQRENMLAAWKNSENEPETRPLVNREIIAATIASMTGIPVQNLAKEEAERLLQMEDEMAQTVINQDEAISAVARAVRRSRSGIKDPNRPTGSFLFLGPSGVGKTWLSKQLSQFMFGSEDSLITIDMSEFMEKHNASRLVGSPPGYVGHEEGGQLTEQVRRKPYSVILFDEIEKAHPDVYNMLLQIMEEGRLTDSLGRHIDFRNTIIIMTSNVGANVVQSGGGLGFTTSEEDTTKRVKEGIMEEVQRQFRPEFLNRLDEIITFNPLQKDDLYRIINIEMKKVEERMAEKKITFALSDKARDFLIDKGFHPEYGARPLRRTIERFIEDPMAEELLRNNIKSGSFLEMDLDKEGEKLSFHAIPSEAAEVEDQKATSDSADE